MVDICMCYNHEDCPLADKCFRAKATPSKYQTYGFMYRPNNKCEYFWEFKTKEELDDLNCEWTD